MTKDKQTKMQQVGRKTHKTQDKDTDMGGKGTLV